MTLSHGGQSEVGDKFSINENVLMDNMQMKTIIAQRKVMDCRKKNGKTVFQCQNRFYKMSNKHTLDSKWFLRKKENRRLRKQMRTKLITKL